MGHRITFLGLLGPPVSGNGMGRICALTSEKSSRCPDTIRRRLIGGVIPTRQIAKFIGKLCFPHTCIFGKFASTQIRFLYRNLHAPRYQASLIPRGRLTVDWRVDVIAKLKPRIPRPRRGPPDFALYTDSATVSDRIDAPLFEGPPALPHPFS